MSFSTGCMRLYEPHTILHLAALFVPTFFVKAEEDRERDRERVCQEVSKKSQPNCQEALAES